MSIQDGGAYFVALGGTEEIGASCHFLQVGGTGILLDAGADPEQEGVESLPRLDLVRSQAERWVDHVVVTHGHHDHIGSLPVVIRTFPHVMVHMTRATRDLCDLLLPASAKLQRKRMMEGSTQAQPLFDVDELGAYSYLYLTHELEKGFDLTGIKGRAAITGRFYDAGHVLGSAGLLMSVEDGDEDRTVFFTGDTMVTPQAIIPGAQYPVGPIDTLVMESTLGADPDAELTTRRKEEIRFGQMLREVLAGGGSVLIPVFALGRGQEILALIDRFRKKGTIDSDVPVYTAGLMRALSDVYDRSRFYSPRLDDSFQLYNVDQERLPRNPANISVGLNEPGIYVVSSGMMFERTISNRIAQDLVEHEKHAVLIVGYARHDSPAQRLLDAAARRDSGQDGAQVNLEPLRGVQTVRCRVDRFRFSGHSNRRDLLALVDRLSPKRVILVHGERRAREWMADNIRFFHPEIEVFAPAQGERVELWD